MHGVLLVDRRRALAGVSRQLMRHMCRSRRKLCVCHAGRGECAAALRLCPCVRIATHLDGVAKACCLLRPPAPPACTRCHSNAPGPPPLPPPPSCTWQWQWQASPPSRVSPSAPCCCPCCRGCPCCPRLLPRLLLLPQAMALIEQSSGIQRAKELAAHHCDLAAEMVCVGGWGGVGFGFFRRRGRGGGSSVACVAWRCRWRGQG